MCKGERTLQAKPKKTEGNNMEKITVFVGLNDKDSKKQEISFIEARSLLSQFIAQVVGVGTLSEAAGVYTHDNGETVQETTIRAEFYVEKKDLEKIAEFVRFAKSILNQESVAVEVSKPAVQFV
jgi:hypothetical protein